MTIKHLLVSVHDVTPHYDVELKVIFAALDAMGMHSRTALIVPDFDGDSPIDANPDFVSMMRAEQSKGAELALHGLNHRYAEFWRLGYRGANAALDRGLDIFQRAFGIVPTGFVAPQWVQSNGSFRAVWEHGFRYTETLRGFFVDGKKIHSGTSLNYDWGIVWLDRMIARRNGRYCECSTSDIVRLAIHPMDVRNGLFDTVCTHLKALQDQGFVPMGNAAFSETVRA